MKMEFKLDFTTQTKLVRSEEGRSTKKLGKIINSRP